MISENAAPASVPVPSDSGQLPKLDEPAMVSALKRKLIECDTAMKSSFDRAEGLEHSLQMEKREHQLTTAKLSQLLKKRGSSPTAADMEKEAKTLKQHVSLLQQQLLLSEEREQKLRQQLSTSIAQYQQLRGIKLDEISAARTLNTVQSSPVLGGRKRPAPGADAPTGTVAAPVATAVAAPVTAVPAVAVAVAVPVAEAKKDSAASEVAPTEAPTVPPASSEPSSDDDAAALDKLVLERMAAIDPARQITPPEQLCQSMWRSRMTEHAEPRVGMPRSLSSSGDAMQRSISHDGALPVGAANNVVGARRGLAMGEVAATQPPNAGVRTPFGYVKGAICVEPPKRQRTNNSSIIAPAKTAVQA